MKVCDAFDRTGGVKDKWFCDLTSLPKGSVKVEPWFCAMVNIWNYDKE